jgi:hypothetical protein
VANHFDIVPVGIEDECTVTALMVMRPQTGLAVVTTSSSQTCCMEAIDRSSIVNYESYVDAGDCSGFEAVSSRVHRRARQSKAPISYEGHLKVTAS